VLKFLSKLFGSAEQPDALCDRALIDAATERTVDATDRRLRALGDYRKRLRAPLECAVSHVIALVDSFPPAAEISRLAFGSSPLVRAFFSSAEQLQHVLGGWRNVRGYLASRGPICSDDIFGLLVMEREERTVLGTELAGDAIRRDVMQVAVNFCRHRYLAAAATEAESRQELKKRGFDYLLERALERLTTERKKRGELEQQRRLLRRKLEAMRAGDWGLGAMLAEHPGPSLDVGAFEAEIEAIDAELGQFGASALSLEQSLDLIAETMGSPADWLATRRICLRLDYRGIKHSDTSTVPPSEIELTELFAASGITRTVLLGRVPRGEIPEQPDFLKQAARYLA
jgi:hypothetical protein